LRAGDRLHSRGESRSRLLPSDRNAEPSLRPQRSAARSKSGTRIDRRFRPYTSANSLMDDRIDGWMVQTDEGVDVAESGVRLMDTTRYRWALAKLGTKSLSRAASVCRDAPPFCRGIMCGSECGAGLRAALAQGGQSAERCGAGGCKDRTHVERTACGLCRRAHRLGGVASGVLSVACCRLNAPGIETPSWHRHGAHAATAPLPSRVSLSVRTADSTDPAGTLRTR
jgi:hypothetical protein